MFRFLFLPILLIACEDKGPKDIGHDLGVLNCKMAKTQLKEKAGKNEKQKKAAAKDLKELTKEHEKMSAEIGKMDKKSQKIAYVARDAFMKNCRL